jgi:putative transposase
LQSSRNFRHVPINSCSWISQYQGRYFSEPIENDSYVLEASKYIHLNPVKAKMVNRPEDYEWSSYGMYIGKAKEKLISSDNILGYFKGNSRLIYKEYVESGIKFEEEGEV